MNDEYSIVYLKAMPDGTVQAFGDVEALNAPLEVGGGAGIYHQTLSAEEWEACGCAAYVDGGRIALGRRRQDVLQEQADAVRFVRNQKLRACDRAGAALHWESMTEAQRQAWRDYRQALLDIPQQPGFPWGGDPDRAPWPVKPE